MTMHGQNHINFAKLHLPSFSLLYPPSCRNPDSMVGTVTRLWAGRSGIRIPLVAKETSLLQSLQTGSRGHPRLTINGNRSSFLGLKRPGGSADHPPPRRAEVKARVELLLCSPYNPVWRVNGNLYPHLFIP